MLTPPHMPALLMTTDFYLSATFSITLKCLPCQHAKCVSAYMNSEMISRAGTMRKTALSLSSQVRKYANVAVLPVSRNVSYIIIVIHTHPFFFIVIKVWLHGINRQAVLMSFELHIHLV